MNKVKIDIAFGEAVVEKVMEQIKNDLEPVFLDRVEINAVSALNLSDKERLTGEVCLVLRPSIMQMVKEHLGENEKAIVASRTITEDAAYTLYDIPQGTRVLVVNDSQETTRDTVSMLYQLKISHLELVPYLGDGENERYSGIEIAVTPAESSYVPSFIKKIVDIGSRRLDMQTFLDIISVTKLGSDSVNQAIINYSGSILELHTGVKQRYIKSYLLNETFNQILSLQKSGIIVTNSDFEICYRNIAAEEILHRKISSGVNIESYLDKNISRQLTSCSFTDELLDIEDHSYIVTRTTFSVMEHTSGYCFYLEAAEHIRKRESELSGKIRKQGLFARYTFDDIIYRSDAMASCIENAKKVASSDYAVLITGETGTGKELFAQAIQNYSHRRNKPFVAVNCAALPESLLESELFGYEGGAFTGAKKEGKPGLFEQAQGGTIFLDEIGDMPYALQSKLLRVLQEQQVVRIGGTQVININVRIITATNCSFKKLISENRFRNDLYYRLNVFPLVLLPLRKRKEDIIPLFCEMGNLNEEDLPDKIIRKLISWPWPGNVRELKNAAKYYNLMGNLDCLISNEESFSEEFIEEKEDGAFAAVFSCEGENIKGAILNIVKERKTMELNTGRQSLMSAMREKNLAVSENRLEKFLHSMQSEGLIIRYKGRKGICITAAGEIYLKQKSI